MLTLVGKVEFDAGGTRLNLDGGTWVDVNDLMGCLDHSFVDGERVRVSVVREAGSVEPAGGRWPEGDSASADAAFQRLLGLAAEARREHNLGYASDLASAAAEGRGDSESGFRSVLTFCQFEPARVEREVYLVRERASLAGRWGAGRLGNLDLAKYRLLVFDADGTLRRSTVPGQPCPNRPGEWELIPGVRDRLHALDWREASFGIASNQGGVALGHLDYRTAWGLLGPLPRYPGSRQTYVELCPHAPGVGCGCRKPGPGLLQRIALNLWHDRNYPLGAGEALYVGDRPEDQAAALAAGYEFAWARRRELPVVDDDYLGPDAGLLQSQVALSVDVNDLIGCLDRVAGNVPLPADNQPIAKGDPGGFGSPGGG